MALGHKTGGRQKGSLNKATPEITRLAQQYTEQAILALAEVLAGNSALAIARIRAAAVLLDRGPGRPTQHIDVRISPLEELSDDELEAGIVMLRAALVH